MFFVRLLIWGALFAAGLATAEGFEHRPPQTGTAAFVGQGLATQRDSWRTRAINAEAVVDGWKGRAGACETKLDKISKISAEQLAGESGEADTRAGAAWDSAYRAGRVAGAKSCGKPGGGQGAAPAAALGEHPDNVGGGPGGGAGDGVAGLLDDLSSSFGASAYRP